ncbi:MULTISPECIES: hypothetical protein [unclassified Pedobacter]|uniref:hypothetical protein n=1 Tax=unclassified Pedobacter TaxID=2628915 RepID=UPI001DB8AA93|nr:MULTISPECIES: hypothetical protein [unclassified Pedobacter]CAH0285275.1 hypothetical protein SRABI36_04138 [Pedobacter sp. Bi36]
MRIVLITSGQPTLNPRLIKEADALLQEGHHVTVIYQYWNDWATLHDADLLAQKKWKAIRTGGSPHENKRIYWYSKLRFKLGLFLFHHFRIASELAIGRCSKLLYKEAKKHPADLYIAHNLAALPAAVRAAKKAQVKAGFDAEDFHRNEVSDDENNSDFALKKQIEEKYMPQADYITASSELISQKYSLILNRDITTILNVFPNKDIEQKPLENNCLKLFWFSQTIGPDRGLEEVIRSLNQIKKPFQLHLLGNITSSYHEELLKIVTFEKENIFIIEPVQPDKIFEIASAFDVGLATECSFPTNRDICLTNKIFTYMQSGLAIIASDTAAQKQFMNQYPAMGLVYKSNKINTLEEIVLTYITNPDLLKLHRINSKNYASNNLNWETEKIKFLSVVNQLLKG